MHVSEIKRYILLKENYAEKDPPPKRLNIFIVTPEV